MALSLLVAFNMRLMSNRTFMCRGLETHYSGGLTQSSEFASVTNSTLPPKYISTRITKATVYTAQASCCEPFTFLHGSLLLNPFPVAA